MSEDRVTKKITEITLADGKKYEIRPLTLGAVKRLAPIVNKLQSNPDSKQLLDPELFDNTIELAWEILKRANKDLTKEAVEDLVDLDNIKEIFSIGFGA